MHFTRRIATLATLAAGLPTLPALGRAAEAAWPNRPVRMLVGYPPGSATDTFGRAICNQLQTSLGQPFVVDNRPGATTNIATEATVHAAPDGYTILNTAVQITINPWLMKVGFDTGKDLIPVTQTLTVTNVLLTGPDFPAKTLPELVEYTKQNPGKANYGSYGAGSASHLNMAMLQHVSGLDAKHIPYRGSPQMLTALMAGEIDMCFDTTTSAAVHVQAGKMRAIALGSPQPLELMPGVPTIASTYRGFNTDAWQGIFVPAGTPKPIVGLLAREIRKALETPELKALGARTGVRLTSSTPEEFGAYVRAELAKYEGVVRENHITVD
ncbi:MAG: tripartite tricarboxylate transporter substrate binding protein [Pseudomonadota bacterium]